MEVSLLAMIGRRDPPPQSSPTRGEGMSPPFDLVEAGDWSLFWSRFHDDPFDDPFMAAR